jgi:hypothetical protein
MQDIENRRSTKLSLTEGIPRRDGRAEKRKFVVQWSGVLQRKVV